MNGCFVHLCVCAWRDERVRAMCVQSAGRVKVLFVLADPPTFLTFLHILYSHGCIALQKAAGQKEK